MSLVAFLQVLALVLFALAMLGVPSHPRFNFGWGGAFCLTLAWFVGSGAFN